MRSEEATLAGVTPSPRISQRNQVAHDSFLLTPHSSLLTFMGMNPFRAAVGPVFFLPDGHEFLETVDGEAAGLERLGPVRTAHGHRHARPRPRPAGRADGPAPSRRPASGAASPARSPPASSPPSRDTLRNPARPSSRPSVRSRTVPRNSTTPPQSGRRTCSVRAAWSMASVVRRIMARSFYPPLTGGSRAISAPSFRSASSVANSASTATAHFAARSARRGYSATSLRRRSATVAPSGSSRAT